MSDMRCAKRRQDSQNGFSLLEIVVVLLLLGLAAYLIAPSFTTGLRGLEARTAARDLLNRLKQARTRAISTQTVSRMLLGHDERGQAFYALANEYEEVLKTFPLPEGTRFVTEDQELPLVISFYPSGRSSGGLFALERDERRRFVIEVDSVTGLGRLVPEDEER